MAGEHSTTEPPMLARRKQFLISIGPRVTKLHLSTWLILDSSSFVCLNVILWLWKQSIYETSQIAMCFRFSCAFIHFHSKFPNNTPPLSIVFHDQVKCVRSCWSGYWSDSKLGAILSVILDSIVVSIPACHAGDRGSIPRRGDNIFRLFIHDERNISRFTF